VCWRTFLAALCCRCVEGGEQIIGATGRSASDKTRGICPPRFPISDACDPTSIAGHEPVVAIENVVSSTPLGHDGGCQLLPLGDEVPPSASFSRDLVNNAAKKSKGRVRRFPGAPISPRPFETPSVMVAPVRSFVQSVEEFYRSDKRAVR